MGRRCHSLNRWKMNAARLNMCDDRSERVARGEAYFVCGKTGCTEENNLSFTWWRKCFKDRQPLGGFKDHQQLGRVNALRMISNEEASKIINN